MRNAVTLRSAGRLLAFAGRPFAAMNRKLRIWREEDALTRVDDCVLRDVGLDRCKMRYLGQPPNSLSGTGANGAAVNLIEDV